MNKDSHLIFENYLNEAKKLAKKDYDKDGKLETPEQEYKGVRDNAIKKAQGKKTGDEDCEWNEDREVTSKQPQYKGAREGKDIGKPGKNFKKIAASAAKRYGSKEAGKRVAGAVLAKMRQSDETMTEAATPHLEQLHMIISDLKSIIEHATSLKGMLNGDTVIEPWVASKVTIAADYIEGIHDYMKYGTQPTDEDHERTGEGSAEDCERCEKKSESRIVVDNLAQRPGETGNYTNATPNGY
jgi:hypothetical protein